MGGETKAYQARNVIAATKDKINALKLPSDNTPIKL
jgi:hypothetical protein